MTETEKRILDLLTSMNAKLTAMMGYHDAAMRAEASTMQEQQLLIEFGKHHTTELAAIRADIHAIKEAMKPGRRH